MSNSLDHNAPEWPFKVLRTFCKDGLIERIEGDMLETFDYRLAKFGEKKAKWMLYRDLISMFKPFALKGFNHSNNSIMMLSNYFKLTIRGIKTNKTTSFISIFGLSVAISCCIVLYLFSMNIITANDFIEDQDQIFMVTSEARDVNNDQFIWAQTPSNLGESLQEEIPSIELMTRFSQSDAVVRYNDVVIEEPIEFVDRDFLKTFSFELQAGSKSALNDPGKIVLTAKAAEKFFGLSDPMDKEMTLIINGESVPVTVGAVAAKLPTNAYFSFNILVNSNLNPRMDNNWKSMTGATFIKFKDRAVIDRFEGLKQTYINAYNASKPRYEIENMKLLRFDEISKTDYFIAGNVVGRENPSTLYGGFFFGFLLLFIACFNYINIALVSATKRLKEIGLRKSVGANRGQLITQFLTQNIFLCLFAVLLGLILAQTILLPLFNSFFPFEFTIDYTSIYLWGFLIGIAVFTGVLSGLYPALYISSFSANNIFKGTLKLGGNKNYLFRFFLGVQFGITFLIIFSGIAFMTNSRFQKNLGWGYDQSGVLAIPTDNNEQYQAFSARLSQYPEVNLMAGGSQHVGDKSTVFDVLINDEKSAVRAYYVSPEYLKTMGFELVEGSFFDKNKASDLEDGIVVNETFLRQYFIEDIETDVVKTSEGEYKVIGVVKDFHYQNFYTPIKSMAFIAAPSEEMKYIVARVDHEQMVSLENKVKSDWATMFPDYPYVGFHQDTVFDNFFREMSIPTRILMLFAAISMILSAIGLYGLVSLMLAKRMREICIRKVMGASMKHISFITNKPYALILGVALIFAIPFSQYLVKNYLDQVNAYHVAVDFKIILPSILLITTVILLTIGANLLKVTRAQPTTTLREK